MADKYPYQSAYSYVGWRPIMVTDPNGMWEQKNGKWVAQKGDSWWSLHEDSGMSWKETKAFAKKYNADKGRKNWKSVRVDDEVTLPDDGPESSSSSSSPSSSGGAASSNSTSTPASSNNNGNNSSNIPSNTVMEEKQVYYTPFLDFATTESSINKTNPNTRLTVNVNAEMQPQSVTYTTGTQNYTIGPTGVSTSNGVLSVGANIKGQFIIGVSLPNVNGVIYSAEIRMNSQQALNTGKVIVNTWVTVGGLVYLRRYVPPVFQVRIPKI
jgi:hypothetical protein